MTKTPYELEREYDSIELSNSMYDCANCGKFLEEVYYEDESWLFCNNCDWNLNHVLSQLDGKKGVNIVE